ncbi:MAG TPA: glycosyltransferase [Candidatus Sulfotelmatobacter sp.]|nr:glycosyltransferase [Candidatus Sulfotelmatobacter sp.]
MGDTRSDSGVPQVSIIIPARNEEANLGSCLESLVGQTGVPFEIIVVDDHSTDHTREIGSSFPGVRVIDAGPLPDCWTGKNNAVTSGAQGSRGEWILFTDADTVHLPGSLARSLSEAQESGAEMLSYSPEQIAVTFWEKAILPVVFAELARQYPPARVSDPHSTSVAANGQYILVKRSAYDAVGGHVALASSILEDVALARAIKSSGHKIRFRYGAGVVSARMYRTFGQLREGWTKNLALLFPRTGWLAAETLTLWLLLPLTLALAAIFHLWWLGVLAVLFVYLTARIARSNFPLSSRVLGVMFGMPMFFYLLLRSQRAHAKGNIRWKGRTYKATEYSMTKDEQSTFPVGKSA